MLDSALKKFQNADYLTQLFHRHALLLNNAVVTSELVEISGEHSSYIGELLLQFHSPDSNIPEKLIIKLSPLGSGVHQALFHQLIHRGKNSSIAPILASGFDSEVSICYILMPDYRATHALLCREERTFSTGLINKTLTKKAITALAHFHNEMMGQPLPTENELGAGRYREELLPLLESIPRCCALVDKFEREGYSQAIAKQLRQLLPEAIHYWNTKIRPRFREGKDITVIHGDCFWHHFWTPQTSSSSVMLFDYDLATVHSPIWDLVTLLSTKRPKSLSRSSTIKLYKQHSSLKMTQKEIEQEFSWLSLCQLYHVLADWEHGCREFIWSTRLNNLLLELPDSLNK